MCLPVAMAIPLALMAVGTVAQYFGNQSAEKAQWSAFNAEQRRQKGFDEQQGALFGESLDKSKKLLDPNETGKEVANRRDTMLAALPPEGAPRETLPGNADGPQVVQNAADRANAEGRAYTEQQASALANLFGFGDQIFKTDIGIGRDAQGINQLGSFRRGSAAALDAELQAAAQKGSTLRGLGGLALSIGSVLGAAGGIPIGGAGAGAGLPAMGAGEAFAGGNGLIKSLNLLRPY